MGWAVAQGFPKPYPSSCAPWETTARLVDGQATGETLRGAAALLQRLEAAIQAAFTHDPDPVVASEGSSNRLIEPPVDPDVDERLDI